MVTFLYGTYSTTRYVLDTNFLPPANSSLGNKLPNLNRGLLSWIPQVWKVTDDQVLEAAGLDAYVVSRIVYFETHHIVSRVLQNGDHVPIDQFNYRSGHCHADPKSL